MKIYLEDDHGKVRIFTEKEIMKDDEEGRQAWEWVANHLLPCGGCGRVTHEEDFSVEEDVCEYCLAEESKDDKGIPLKG